MAKSAPPPNGHRKTENGRARAWPESEVTKMPPAPTHSNAVFTVGLSCQGPGGELVARLLASGYAVTELRDVDGLGEALQRSARSMILVYSPPESETAERVLACVSRSARHTPVLVLVDEADFGHYYNLMMHSAATDYLALSEDPDVLLSVVQRTSEMRAA